MDTNVLYQALRSIGGASHFILGLVRARKVQLLLSVAVFEEYRDVLNRSGSLREMQLTRADISHVLAFLAYDGEPVAIHFKLRPNLRDEADNMFIELAFAGQARYVITNNTKDFRSGDLKFDGFDIVTPAEFSRIWRKTHED